MKYIVTLSFLLLSFAAFGQDLQQLDPSQREAWKRSYRMLNSEQKVLGLPPAPAVQQNPVIPVQPIAAPSARGQSQEGPIRFSANGKPLTPEGYELEFELPRESLASGICGTRIPTVPGANTRANCPVQSPCDVAANRNAAIPTGATPIKYFNIRWTVVRDGTAASNITQAGVDLLMNELNADFLPWRIQFCAAPANFVNDITHYTLNVITEDASLKSTHGANFNQVVNVYVVGSITNPGAGGYAYFPYDPFGGTNARGGIVLSRSNSAPGSHTLAHEMGHVFGLHHTFRGVSEVNQCSNCYERVSFASGAAADGDTEGDWCSDTHPHPNIAFVCGPPGSSSTAACDLFNWNNTPFQNHMSYSFCATQNFSPQQAGRMHCMINTYLGSWVAAGGTVCGNQPPVAAFSGAPTLIQAGMTVQFTDQSLPSGLVTGWQWNFDVGAIGGVTPATFVGQNPPPVQYNTPGTYTVRLTASNANGSNTATRTAYITVVAPATDCDTLDVQWNTPPPTRNFYTWGVNDYVTGVPNTNNEFAYLQRFFTPNAGTSQVGAVRLGLASFLDPDSSMRISIVVYRDNGTGAPDIAFGPIGSLTNIEPGGDLAVPGGNFFTEVWVPFPTLITIPTTRFHIGISISGNGPGDRLVVISTLNGQGQTLGNNYVLANPLNPAAFNYLTSPGYGIDFDLNIIPMMGEWPATTIVTDYLQLVGCDSTFALLVNEVLFAQTLVSMTVNFSTGGQITTSNPATVDSLFFIFTTPPPISIQFNTLNACGRSHTRNVNINYGFQTSPIADFSKVQPNPICMGTSVTFNATPATGISSYQWDWGDGSSTTTAGATANHTYNTPGRYYVRLVATDANSCGGERLKLDFVEIVNCSVTPPAAAFSVMPVSGCASVNFAFSDGSANNPSAWVWDFGDGTFSAQQNPSHTFSLPGTYTITLSATNAGGTTTATQSVVVNDCPLSTPVQLFGMRRQYSAELSWSSPFPAYGGAYTVERQTGIGFDPVGIVEGGAAGLYVFSDENAPRGLLRYRVRWKLADGSEGFSNTIELSDDNPGGRWLAAHPNPLTAGTNLRLTAWTDAGEVAYLVLRDGMGRELTRMAPSAADSGWHNWEMRLPALAAGVYLLDARSSEGRTAQLRIVVR